MLCDLATEWPKRTGTRKGGKLRERHEPELGPNAGGDVPACEMQALFVCGSELPTLFPEPNENEDRKPEEEGQDPKSSTSPDAHVSSLAFPTLAKSCCFMGAELPLLAPHNA